MRSRFLAVATAIAAVLAATPVALAVLAGYADQYPGDPFAFACTVPPVDVSDGANTLECSLMLTACIDAATGPCAADPLDAKVCRDMHVQCMEWADAACWAYVP